MNMVMLSILRTIRKLAGLPRPSVAKITITIVTNQHHCKTHPPACQRWQQQDEVQFHSNQSPSTAPCLPRRRVEPGEEDGNQDNHQCLPRQKAEPGEEDENQDNDQCLCGGQQNLTDGYHDNQDYHYNDSDFDHLDHFQMELCDCQVERGGV